MQEWYYFPIDTCMFIILYFFGLIGYYEISDILLKKSTSESTEEDWISKTLLYDEAHFQTSLWS